MKVLLLNPPFFGETHVREGRCQFKSDLDLPWPPMTLLQIFSILKDKHEVMLVDCMTKKITPDKLKKILEDFLPEAAIINTATHTIYSDLAICDLVKEISPDTKTIAIGTHVSALPSECLENEHLDFVVRREPEFTVEELIYFIEKGKNLSKVKGISFKREEKVHHNPDRPFCRMEELPMPDYDQLHIKDYKSPFYGSFGIINTSRGCPNGCTFCLTKLWYGSCLREKPIENVIQEVKKLHEIGAESLQFYADAFTLNKRWVKKLCKELNPLGIKWFCNSRVDTISKEMLGSMKSAGCEMIGYGIETMNQKSLDYVRKGQTINQIKRAVQTTNDSKIDVFGYFVFGFPYETEETLNQNIEFSLKSGMSFAGFSIATPFPGTKFYDYSKKGGSLITDDWGKYHYNYAVISSESLSSRDLMNFQRKAYESFYSRPRYGLKLIKKTLTRNPSSTIPSVIKFMKKRILK